jgi:hypothetical protein
MWGGWTRGRRVEEPRAHDAELFRDDDRAQCSISTMTERRCGTVRDEDGKARLKCETIKRKFRQCPGEAPVEIESKTTQEDVDGAMDQSVMDGGSLGGGAFGGQGGFPAGATDPFVMMDEMMREMTRGFGGGGMRFGAEFDSSNGGHWFAVPGHRHGGGEDGWQQVPRRPRHYADDDDNAMGQAGGANVPQPPDLPASAQKANATAEERRRNRMYASVSTEV